ncbi:hypothetical protein BCR34DRAFT_535608 [Clohesyomyces aquaticus]|uniref:Uncharacterized protein n=1 Tax=Clohesyomyces aquaticus TaxID=1231657 RepID=A0A1Y1ZT50_9PLEO|nr:hypothetical protein BCR34DRAFT_535608 [Clohesyomyces aquaticus]
MAPHRPKSITAGHDPIVVFDGAISVRQLTHPTRLFNLEVIFDDHHPHMLKLREQIPPQYFQYLQVEYVKVLEGSLYLDIGKKRVLLTPSDDEREIPTWTRNRAFPGPLSAERRLTKFLLSGPAAAGTFMLDTAFYENYYRYMDRALAPGGEGISIIQVLSMFDAGGSCLALPRFIPFNMCISRVMGVVVGRWLGGLLGYQPYYKEWTTDWETAKARKFFLQY